MDAHTRREQMIALLMERGKISSTEFAEMYHVSKNTIVHDMWLLCRRYPITVESGRYGGYRYAGEKVVEISEKEAAVIQRVMKKYKNEMADDVYNSIMKKFEQLGR